MEGIRKIDNQNDNFSTINNGKRKLSDKFQQDIILEFINEDAQINTEAKKAQNSGCLNDSRMNDFLDEFETEWPKETIEEFIEVVNKDLPIANLSIDRVQNFMRNAHMRLSAKIEKEKNGERLNKDLKNVQTLRAEAILNETRIILDKSKINNQD